jgi:hypothetical protein
MYTSTKEIIGEFMAMNMVGGKPYVVGSITLGLYTPTEISIVFPGGVPSAPESVPPAFNFSWIGKNARRVDGVLSTAIGVPCTIAGELALSEIIASPTLLPGW